MLEEGDHYKLTVRDDGPGMQPGLDTSTATSLGLSLVSALAGQLDGELLITSRKGAEFTIRFPADIHGKMPGLPAARPSQHSDDSTGPGT